ncbi:hypothetical protein ABMA27_008061 [Loxostege sticticalis]|uniref:Uncharacterized protein n=1 Tax=Loxostege sticticalis TaxID=481309 RepID=A0ABR3HDU5_LOXSC
MCTPLFSAIKVWMLLFPTVYCHIPNYVSTPSNRIDQFCNLADTCIHDTIPICGRMGDEQRSFLDLCDMLEYACDTSQGNCSVTRVVDSCSSCDLFAASLLYQLIRDKI